jgi:predicted nucleic acid-binding protein
MSAAVLADTGPLYALADPSDQYHERAHNELARLQAQGCFVAVAYPTLAEAYTLVLHRLGAKFAAKWLKEMLAGTATLNPEPGDYLGAAAHLASLPGRKVTLFDAVTAALGNRLAVKVWTFDRDFDLLRVARWK